MEKPLTKKAWIEGIFYLLALNVLGYFIFIPQLLQAPNIPAPVSSTDMLSGAILWIFYLAYKLFLLFMIVVAGYFDLIAIAYISDWLVKITKKGSRPKI